jgi:predicted N-acetyltransferase YhbS
MAAPTTEASVEIARLPADFDRWQELLDLIMRAFAYMDGVIDPPSSAHKLTTGLLEAKAKAETVLIAIADGKLVGCVSLADRGDHAYLGKLAVDPALQGKGIGRRLVEAVEAEAIRQGKSFVELQTRVELTGNQAIFARLGYRETERTAHTGFSRPTSVTMRKELSA